MDGATLLPTRLITDPSTARAAGEQLGRLLVRVGGGDLSWLRLPRAVATAGASMSLRGDVQLAVGVRAQPDGYVVEATLSADDPTDALPLDDLLVEARRLVATAVLSSEHGRTRLRLRTTAAPPGVIERLIRADEASSAPPPPAGWSTTDLDPSADLVRSLEKRLAAAERRVDELEAADATEQSRTDFLSRMSHEMRTPLNGILGMTTLMANSITDPEQRQQLETVRSSGEHLLTLINDLLDFARIDAGALLLELVPVDLAHSVEDAVAVVSPLARAKGLDLQVRLQPMPRVISDPGRLRQVLLNLLGNAVKFTDRGHVEVDLTGSPRDSGHWDVQIEVSDTGIGISPSQLAEVFAPFVQGRTGAQRQSGGTGLGLTIARALAERLGGEIDARSRPGHGSVFCLSLLGVPTAEGPAVDEHPEPVEEFVSGLSETHPLRVLVAEDSPANQQVVRLMLERLGYLPDVVADGAEAVLATMRQHYDLVLMDVHMPVLDGLAATREIIRSLPPGRRPRVVGLSAAVTADDEHLGRAAGMDGYLTKPLRPGPLSAVLRGTVPLPVIRHTGARTGSTADTDANADADAGSDADADIEPPPTVDREQVELTRELFGPDYPGAVALWQATTEKGFRAVRAADRAADLDALREAAHSIKGGALNMGATDLAQQAQAIEQAEELPDEEVLARFAATFDAASLELSAPAPE